MTQPLRSEQFHLSPYSTVTHYEDTLNLTLVRLEFDVALASNTTSDPSLSSLVDRCPHKNRLGMLHFTHWSPASPWRLDRFLLCSCKSPAKVPTPSTSVGLCASLSPALKQLMNCRRVATARKFWRSKVASWWASSCSMEHLHVSWTGVGNAREMTSSPEVAREKCVLSCDEVHELTPNPHQDVQCLRANEHTLQASGPIALRHVLNSDKPSFVRRSNSKSSERK